MGVRIMQTIGKSIDRYTSRVVSFGLLLLGCFLLLSSARTALACPETPCPAGFECCEGQCVGECHGGDDAGDWCNG